MVRMSTWNSGTGCSSLLCNGASRQVLLLPQAFCSTMRRDRAKEGSGQETATVRVPSATPTFTGVRNIFLV